MTTTSNLLHIRYSAGSVSITLRDLPLEISVSDLLARAELRSSIPAQLTELLDLAMAPLPFNFVLSFGANMRTGMLLTMGVHPAWAEIVECATTNKWKEVMKKAKIIGSDATEVCLFLAMKYGTSETVASLLQLGVFIHGASLYGRTSLHMAAFHGRSEIIHHLIGAGLDSSITDAFGKTAVDYARENEYFEAARWCWLGRWQYGSQGGIKLAKSDEQPRLLQAKEKTKRPQSTKAPPPAPPTAPPKPKTKNDSYKKKVNEWLNETSKAATKQEPLEKSIMKKPTELKISPTEPVISPPLHVNFAPTTESSKNIQKMVVEVPMIVPPGARKPQSPPPIQTNQLEAETRTKQNGTLESDPNKRTTPPPKPSHVFISRAATDREHHVDQLGKYEIDKIEFNPPPPIEPDTKYTMHHFPKELDLNLLLRQKSPEQVNVPKEPLAATIESKPKERLEKRDSVPPQRLTTSAFVPRSSTTSAPAVRKAAPQRNSSSSASTHAKQQESEETKRQANEEAYQRWLVKKKRVVIKSYSPDSAQNQRKDLKWYENKKRMFKPDDLEPRYKPRPIQQQRAQIQETIHKPKPRQYSGNGVTFEEWIKQKQLPAKQTDESDKDAEKRKANELRQLMAQEKFKEWLADKVQKQREETRTEEEQYASKNHGNDGLSFNQWLQTKQKNERALKRLIQKMQKNDDNEAESEQRHRRNMTFEDWMIRKEEEELEQWRRERELAKKARQMEKAKKVQVQEMTEQTSLPRRSSPSPPTPPPSSPPRSQAPAQQLESEQVGDKSDKGVDGNDNDEARVSPDQRTNQQVDVPVPSKHASPVMEVVVVSPPSPQSPTPPPFERFDADNPFISDADDDNWSDHSSLAGDIEDSELLKLIDHLDSD